MKPIWKGYLKVSLLTIPIKMYNATSKKRSIQFNLLHKDYKGRIKQKTFCPTCNKELADEDLIRGYQYGKDMDVLITDEDLHKAQKESTDAIEIVKFIDEEQIHPIYYSDSNYLVPDGKIGIDAFSLFHRAMLETKKAALAKIVIRNREHIFSISPYDGALIAYSLHYPEEVQEIGKIEEVNEVEKISTDINTLSMAKAIIRNFSGEFNLEEYTDEYTQTLMEIIKPKAEGEEIKVEPKVERAKVISFMDALEKSVKETMKTKEEVPRKAMAIAGKKAKEPSLKRKKALDV